MDPSRISLEDDRFGLIGVSFRPQNRATYIGRDGDDHVWSVGIVVGDEDEIQTVEIDEHGAKSSRMLTPGELFEGLEILATPGSDAYLIVGTLTLLGMELRSSGSETAHEFAELLRAAADDRSWRLPLHLIGQPRDLQLSAQGRDILRQTASSIDLDGEARTSLSAAHRLELSSQALDSIRRRIARKSLQAYRMHGRWYVVLDNLARSRSAEMNGTSASAVPSTPLVAETPPSPFEEVSSEIETEPEGSFVAEIADEDEPFVSEEPAADLEPEHPAESQEEPSSIPAEELEDERVVAEGPTEDQLSAFLSEDLPTSDGQGTEIMTPDLSAGQTGVGEPGVEESIDRLDSSIELEASPEQQAVQDALSIGDSLSPGEHEPSPSEVKQESWEDVDEEHASPEVAPDASQTVDESATGFDQVISETVLEQFIVTDIDLPLSEEQRDEAAATSTFDHEAGETDEESEDLVAESTPAEPSELETAIDRLELDAEPEMDESSSPEIVLDETMTSEAAEPEVPATEVAEPEAPATEAAEQDVLAVDDEGEPDVLESETLVAETPEIGFEEEHADAVASDFGRDDVGLGAEPDDLSAPEIESPMPLAAEESIELEEIATGEEHRIGEESETLEQAPESAEESIELEEAATGEQPRIAEESETLEPAPHGEPLATDESEVVEATAEDQAASIVESEDQAEDVGLTETEGETAVPPPLDDQAEDFSQPESEGETSEDAQTSSEEDLSGEGWEEPEPTEAEMGADSEARTAGSDIGDGDIDLLRHLRDEVAFLRQQGREKDRQIVAWINGGQWLQPFVDQIHSLEQQVERLGELQASRDSDRISDLVSERDTLRQRMATLEKEIESERVAKAAADANRRSWFRRMMGSD